VPPAKLKITRNIKEMIMSKLLSAALAIAAAFTLSTAAQAKPYKCWNPAICKAVCGKAICGADIASKAQQEDMKAKNQVKAAPAKPQR